MEISKKITLFFNLLNVEEINTFLALRFKISNIKIIYAFSILGFTVCCKIRIVQQCIQP